MKLTQWGTIAFAGLLLPSLASAQDNPATNATEAAEIQALKQEIQALDQKVQALEQRHDAEQQAATNASTEQIQALNQKVQTLEQQRKSDEAAAMAAAKTEPKISIGTGGLSFMSADSNFVAAIHGLVQVDGREFFANNGVKGNDGILIRRSRPAIFSATVFHDFDLQLTPDFGGTTVQILDAYINYRYNPRLQLQAGKFKPPIGLEQLQGDPATSFNERSLVTDLTPNRDIGAELHGDVFGGAVSYAAGLFDGAPDFNSTTANTDSDNNKAFVGRIFLQPWKTSDAKALRGFGVGVGGSYESDRNGASGLTPGYKTDGQQIFFTYTNGVSASGIHWRISPQAYYYLGPFSLLGEYAISDQEISKGAASTDLHNKAWEISGSWVMTGEDATYMGVTPLHPFDPHQNQWGAWQLVARYAMLDIDDAAFPVYANPNTSASAARAWAAGVNWYLNKNIRVNASFSRTTFTGGNGAGSTVTQQPENAFFTRIQLIF